jgi:hypothetical protein
LLIRTQYTGTVIIVCWLALAVEGGAGAEAVPVAGKGGWLEGGLAGRLGGKLEATLGAGAAPGPGLAVVVPAAALGSRGNSAEVEAGGTGCEGTGPEGEEEELAVAVTGPCWEPPHPATLTAASRATPATTRGFLANSTTDMGDLLCGQTKLRGSYYR